MAGWLWWSSARSWCWGTVSMRSPLPLPESHGEKRERISETNVWGIPGGRTALWLTAQAAKAMACDCTLLCYFGASREMMTISDCVCVSLPLFTGLSTPLTITSQTNTSFSSFVCSYYFKPSWCYHCFHLSFLICKME